MNESINQSIILQRQLYPHAEMRNKHAHVQVDAMMSEGT